MPKSATGRTLRAGVIGAGIGRVHIDALRRIGVEVSVLASSSVERARDHARRLDIPRICETAIEVTQSPDVDVVHVCTPNGLHYEQVLSAIAAGKHVVCEKPLAVSSVQGQDLLEAAERAGVVHAVAYTYRYYPAIQRMRSLTASGQLGQIHLIRGCYLNDEMARIAGTDHWMLKPQLMGPALILGDTGVHWWDLIEFVTGTRIVEVVCTHTSARSPAGKGEDSAAILLRLDNGASAVGAISGTAAGHGNTIELEVMGAQAALGWGQEEPDTLWKLNLGAPAQRLVRDGSEPSTVDSHLELPAGHIQGYLDAFRHMMAAIYGSISGVEGANHPTFEDGVRGLRVLEALLLSAAKGKWVTV